MEELNIESIAIKFDPKTQKFGLDRPRGKVPTQSGFYAIRKLTDECPENSWPRLLMNLTEVLIDELATARYLTESIESAVKAGKRPNYEAVYEYNSRPQKDETVYFGEVLKSLPLKQLIKEPKS